jgi:hypothetical protein
MDRLTPPELWTLFQMHGKPAGVLSPLGFVAKNLKKPSGDERRQAHARLVEDDFLVASGGSWVPNATLRDQLRILYAPEAVIDATAHSPQTEAPEVRTLFFLAGDVGLEGYATETGFDFSAILPRQEIYGGLAKATAPGFIEGHHLVVTDETYKFVCFFIEVLRQIGEPAHSDDVVEKMGSLFGMKEEVLIDILARLNAGGVLNRSDGGLLLTAEWAPLAAALDDPWHVTFGIRHARRPEKSDAFFLLGPPGERVMIEGMPHPSPGEDLLDLSWPGQAGLAQRLDEMTRKDRFTKIETG